MRLHFTIGCYDCRGTNDFVRVSISAPFCWSCALTLRSRQQILVPQELMQASTSFPKVRRMLLCFPPFIFFNFWPASALLRGHIALAIPFLLETGPQILERWDHADEVHLGKSIRAKDFGLECMRDVQQLLWILHVGSVSACLSSSVKSTKTSAPCPGICNPIVVYLMSRTQQVRGARDSCHGKQRVSPFYRTTHASSTWLPHFCHHSF